MYKYFYFLILIISGCFAQEKIVYHSFYSTASDPKLTRWNVEVDTLKDLYIRELVDSEGRVTELKFMHGQKIVSFTVFNPSIIKFRYNADSIIEIRLYADGFKLNGAEAGIPYKIIYGIKDGIINSSIEYFDIKPYFTTYAHHFSEEALQSIRKEYELKKDGVVSNRKFHLKPFAILLFVFLIHNTVFFENLEFHTVKWLYNKLGLRFFNQKIFSAIDSIIL